MKSNFKVTSDVNNNVGILSINKIPHIIIKSISSVKAIVTYYDGPFKRCVDIISYEEGSEICIKNSYDNDIKWKKVIKHLIKMIKNEQKD